FPPIVVFIRWLVIEFGRILPEKFQSSTFKRLDKIVSVSQRNSRNPYFSKWEMVGTEKETLFGIHVSFQP
ncbi:hypothetical protein OFO11_35610, partial [Escherichia coli]|nr:hypothetical protein [Escherichia coli]